MRTICDINIECDGHSNLPELLSPYLGKTITEEVKAEIVSLVCKAGLIAKFEYDHPTFIDKVLIYVAENPDIWKRELHE